MQRYVELKGQLQRVVAVVKMRESAHSKDVRIFDITDKGIAIGERLVDYEGLLTGRPEQILGRQSRANHKTPTKGRAKRPTP